MISFSFYLLWFYSSCIFSSLILIWFHLSWLPYTCILSLLQSILFSLLQELLLVVIFSSLYLLLVNIFLPILVAIVLSLYQFYSPWPDHLQPIPINFILLAAIIAAITRIIVVMITLIFFYFDDFEALSEILKILTSSQLHKFLKIETHKLIYIQHTKMRVLISINTNNHK